MRQIHFPKVIATFLIAALGLISFSTAAETTKTLLIPEVKLLRGEFEQTRYLKGFKNPLKSEGRFLVSKADGVIWQSLKPFSSQIVVTNTGKVVNLTTKQSNKKPNPGMTKIMHAVVSGDQTAMAKYFVIQRTEGSNGSWTIQLQPKGGMARVFSHIEVKGDRYVKQVLLEEKSSDKTELRFSALSEVPNSLTAEEKKYFQ